MATGAAPDVTSDAAAGTPTREDDDALLLRLANGSGRPNDDDLQRFEAILLEMRTHLRGSEGSSSSGNSIANTFLGIVQEQRDAHAEETRMLRQANERLEADCVWMVDPLDGTKEFIRRNGEFSVNIGLADHGSPVLGVVYCPSSGVSYFAAQGQGAWRQAGSGTPEPIQVSVYDPAQPRMVASRSHAGEAVTAFRQALAAKSGSDPAIVSMGSALKVCVVAEGNADVYPRLAPTSEWDTCASHCVLNEAGGRLVDCNGTELSYNRENILNPWFVAMADPDVDWLEFCPPQKR